MSIWGTSNLPAPNRLIRSALPLAVMCGMMVAVLHLGLLTILVGGGRGAFGVALAGLEALMLISAVGLLLLKMHHELANIRWSTAAIELRTEQIWHLEADRTIRELQSLPKYHEPKRLAAYEAKVYSQSGEDGVIQEVFRRIGTTNRTLCEFGCAAGVENTTALLIRLGWTGVWIDGDARNVAKVREGYREEISTGRLKAFQSFVTAENIERTLAEAGLPFMTAIYSASISTGTITMPGKHCTHIVLVWSSSSTTRSSPVASTGSSNTMGTLLGTGPVEPVPA